MQTTFHNTAGLSGNELTAATNRAKKENDIILEVMAKIGQSATAWEIYGYWVHNKVTPKISHCLLQNIRRSLTNLEKMEKVANTGQRRLGGSGVGNFIWRLI